MNKKSEDDSRDPHGEGLYEDDDRPNSGWWILPSAVLGVIAWIFIIRAIWGWLA